MSNLKTGMLYVYNEVILTGGMNMLKKIMVLFLIAFTLGGCNLVVSKNQLPVTKPKDFNFVYNYGINAKNQLDTVKGQYTKDMIMDPSVTTNLILTDEEINSIYLEMRKINIWNFSENLNSKSNQRITPFQAYSIKIVVDGKEKIIDWEDKSVSESKDAVKLRKLFEKIEEIICNKEEYKKLPPAKGGYK